MKKLSLFIILGIISLLVILNNSIVYGQQQKIFNATSSEKPKFFAIQHSQSGSISEINQTFTLSLNNESNKTMFSSDISRNFILELNNVSDKTIMFSDRPDRIVKSISTIDFKGNWTIGEDSFAIDAPNAVLVIDEIEEKQDTAIIELFNPVYDFNKKTLTYIITPDNATSIDLPKEFGQTTLIIDSPPCESQNGVSLNDCGY